MTGRGDPYSVAEAAGVLGINEARVRALIRDRLLNASKVGGRWLILREAIEQRQRSVRSRGRPLQPASAWSIISDRGFAVDLVHSSAGTRDSWRRRLSSRAEMRSGFAHPAALARVQRDHAQVLIGGRAAADAAGVPAGADPTFVEIYVPTSTTSLSSSQVEWNASTTNLIVRFVGDDLWPLPVEDRFTRLLIAWLDLADRGDRGADMVLTGLATELAPATRSRRA